MAGGWRGTKDFSPALSPAICAGLSVSFGRGTTEDELPNKEGILSPQAETIECPLCSGAGALTRSEILDRLGVRDFARVAQLSAEEAFRLLQNKHDREHQTAWSRFETELAKRTVEIREQHKDELRSAQSGRDDLTRRIEDCLRELADL